MRTPPTTRRSVLQALGVGTAASLAGCTVGNDSQLKVSPADVPPANKALQPAKSVDISRVAADPTDIPAPVTRSSPSTVEAEIVTRELTAEIEPGVTFNFMTFGGQIPGPMIRARVGDTVDLTLTNHESNSMPHNIDLHACRGPGGGAVDTLVNPGESKHIRFKTTYPGAFIYHCAVANLDYHISSGMFGMIVVEPEEGLPAVDHEFYLGQHEVYTNAPAGEKGHHEFDFASMLAEDPSYVLLSGEKYALTPDKYDEMNVKTGETARVFFVVGGPNLTSSWHAIGSVWDDVYAQGSLASPPRHYVQTTPVLPGSTAVTTMSFPVPGNFKLVDHALTRVARKGALAVVHADGPANPDVFDPNPA